MEKYGLLSLKYLCYPFLSGALDICCDPSKEPFQQDSSKDGSQYMFYWKLRKATTKISLLSFLSRALWVYNNTKIQN